MTALLLQVPFTLIFVVLMLYLIAFCKRQFYYAGRTVEKVKNIPNWHSSLALKAHIYLRTRENSIKIVFKQFIYGCEMHGPNN